MPNFQYHVVKTDKDEFEIFIAANEDGSPGEGGWGAREQILHLLRRWKYRRRRSLSEEAAKLLDQKEGEAKGAADDKSAKKMLEAETAKLPDQKNSDEKDQAREVTAVAQEGAYDG